MVRIVHASIDDYLKTENGKKSDRMEGGQILSSPYKQQLKPKPVSDEEDWQCHQDD